MEKTDLLLSRKVLICVMITVVYLSTSASTNRIKMVYKLTMGRATPEDAITECKKGGGYLAPMDSLFTPHLIHVMEHLFEEKKLEVQHKFRVGIRWIPERNNWIWLHDGLVVPESIVEYWELPKTPTENFCTCIWMSSNNKWTMGTFMCGPLRRTVCRYDKGSCSYIKCPGNGLLPMVSDDWNSEYKVCSSQECEDSCSGYQSSNMSCVGYSYSQISSQCILQLSRIQPIWNSSYLHVVPHWEASILNCFEIIHVASLKPLDEYLVYPLEAAKLCIPPPVDPRQREVLISLPNTTVSAKEGSQTGGSELSSDDPGSDWSTTETSVVSHLTIQPTTPSKTWHTSTVTSAVTSATFLGSPTHTTDINTSYAITPVSTYGETSETIPDPTASFVTSIDETETGLSGIVDNECICMCGKGDNFTKEEKQAWLTELVGNLTIDVKKTGLCTRRYISIDDPRPTAQGYGYVAISLLSTILGILVCMDSVTMCATFNAKRCRGL